MLHYTCSSSPEWSTTFHFHRRQHIITMRSTFTPPSNSIYPRHVARNFDRGGKQQPTLNIWLFNVLCFRSIIREWCIFLALFEKYYVQIEARKYIVHFRWIKSLFLIKFQVSILNESHNLFVKLSCKSACENLDVLCMPFAANVAVVIVVIVAAIIIAFLYLDASDVHQHTLNRSRVTALL